MDASRSENASEIAERAVRNNDIRGDSEREDLRGKLEAPEQLAIDIRGNQVILEVNREPVRSGAEFRALVSALRPGDVAALLVYDRSTRQRVISPVVLDGQP